MPTVPLPADPNLEQLRHQARTLQRAVRAGEPAALARIAEHHPAGVPAEAARAGFPRHAAQLVIAREYGFTGWPRLKRHLDVVTRYRRDPDPLVPSGGTPLVPSGAVAAEFCRSACLNYDDDGPRRWAEARRLLAERPDLTAGNIWAAAAAAEPAAVARLLAGAPELAGRDGPPYGWPPLCYLSYSRLDPEMPAEPVLATARLLLDAGADPNAGFLWHGLPTPFTVLTGVFGEGEQGSGRQPRHPHSLALARLLLAAGADPNDGQALYNRMFGPDDDHLVLLFEFGLGSGDGGPWRRRLGPMADPPAALLRRQLEWAVAHGFADRVRLLLRHGVDVRAPLSDGRTPVEVAAAQGHAEVVEVLAGFGVPAPVLRGVDALVAAVLAGERRRVATLLAGDSELLAAAVARHPTLILRAGATGRPEAVELAAELGFDPDATVDGATALHWAAWRGDLEVARRLVRAGADLDRRDDRYHGTPQDWAGHAHRDALVDYLIVQSGARSGSVPDANSPEISD
ncbi:ankyrin repeat domain-containing protein [Plantactinospora soyae]|uniref:Ankyrin repeat protein n=1 Tax=Plantactinospora soyae TaxID=1544732 RepID=A0A927M604_9ACTN|nr:ankyrin repeat domain-containing protein [Plantactinospora soyae]MBE1488808.1 ankyrin repeat protein [Plantactinospora soyae]